MLGWDVGYVWPLLEGVVITQRPADSWQLVMGHPHEPQNSAETPVELPTPQTTPTIVVEPPAYEAVVPERPSSHPPPRDSRQNNSTRNAALQRPQKWPHKASSLFACLCCVVSVSNVSRFSVLVNFYKGCFIFQFLLLSCVIGIPLLYMQMALGQYLGAGMLDMWYISPAFKGLGFAMLYIYMLLGIYSAIPISWLFIYWKDSFVTLKDSYKWGKCHLSFGKNECLQALNSSSADFYGWTVPSYFHGRVLGRKAGEYQIGELKFEVAMHLCLVWIIIFICLSRGHKTFGKIVYVFSVLPISLLLMVVMRLGQQWGQGISELLSSSWRENLQDSNTWSLAAREAFITWGLFGTVALHICSHNKSSANVTKNLIAVAVIGVSVLISCSFIFACANNIFDRSRLSFTYSSYEEEGSVKVLNSGIKHHVNASVTSLVLGVSVTPTNSVNSLSGYQVLRLATEVFPAALAVEGVRSISSFWAICFYTGMILLGIGQQIVMWYCVMESIVAINPKVLKSWHTTLTFVTCNLAFLFGLPFTSNVGIYIVYYLDVCVSSLWWIVLMYFIMLFAVLFIRGRPYGTDQLVNIITRNPIRRSKILPFFTFMWNIVLPFSFLLLTVSFLKTSSLEPNSAMGELLDAYPYWQQWAKRLNLTLQMFPLLLLILVFIYQAFKIFRHKSDKPFMEKLKLLCCPVIPLPTFVTRNSENSFSLGSNNGAFLDDPPPKYTPPPSYSTATSRMLAKQLAQSDAS